EVNEQPPTETTPEFSVVVEGQIFGLKLVVISTSAPVR
ncbi:MAG: hypothetical protein RJA01_24, partial [Actinomycetota bacterium]